MQYHRSGQLDERRRRVLTEEIINSASNPIADSPDTETGTPRRASVSGRAALCKSRYGVAVSMDRQLRIAELVPRSYLVITLWFLAGAAVVGGLESLYWWMPQWSQHTTDGRIAAFDLDDEGSLATWFSSAMLGMCALMALLVYSIRKHRLDDYHGRYRIWLWAAACWMLMSIDEGSSLHEGFKELMTFVTGQRLFGDGSIWWVGPYLLLLGTVGFRLLMDMRECRLSSAAFIMVALCYAAAVATQLELILPESGARGIMLEEGLEMAGTLFLLLAMTLHARHVILDAEGALPERAGKAKAEKKPASKSRSKAAAKETAAAASESEAPRRGWFFGRRKKAAEPEAKPAEEKKAAAKATERSTVIKRSDLGTPPKPAATTASTQATTQRTDSAEQAAGNHRKLSKAERRALRRSRRDRDYDDDYDD